MSAEWLRNDGTLPRVKDEEIETLKAMWANNPERIGYLAYSLALDLQDARKKITELERFSESQEEAMRLMENGHL